MTVREVRQAEPGAHQAASGLVKGNHPGRRQVAGDLAVGTKRGLADEWRAQAFAFEREVRELVGHVYLSERSYGSVRRSFRVPDSVKTDEIKADFKDGVLTLSMPKSEESKTSARRIEIG